MKFFVEALLREQDARVRPPRGGKDGSMRWNWFGLAPKLLGILTNFPSSLAWARVALPERIADKRALIKDDTDEDLYKIFGHEAF